MSDLLRRSLAPISDEAWAEIDAVAARSLKPYLSARSVIEVSGPHGWDFAAVNLGRLNVVKQEKGPGVVNWGTRSVLPLVELRAPFFLNEFELDNLSRGAKDPDLDAVEAAAREVALFEETAIYNGCAKANIGGLLPSCSNKALRLPANAEQYPKAIAEAVNTLLVGGVGGPYGLVVGSKPYQALSSTFTAAGQSLLDVVKSIIGGPVVWSPVVEGAVLVSMRGGDFELTIGQDLSIGYWSHDRLQVEFFLTESFTFRVLQKNAAIELKLAGK